MALVNYSDSESETEAPPPAPKPSNARPAFQKVVDRSAPGKIKVELPTLKSEPNQPNGSEPPAKRARTGGAFSGFNSLLPPPKQRIQKALKPGISLKTSGEAAFIRGDVGAENTNGTHDSEAPAALGSGTSVASVTEKDATPAEPKLVGKVTRFVPLSVANRKKKPIHTLPSQKASKATETPQSLTASSETAASLTHEAEPAKPKPKPKKSLFMVPQEESEEDASTAGRKDGAYEPLLETHTSAVAVDEVPNQPDTVAPAAPSNPNSLQTMALEMNLTAPQLRQLFGRNAKNASVAHFDMEAEYAANEELRKAGEVVEHRAVKAIAPGKHSLQQLVNNARSQKDAMEDAWAEGRRNRGEGGSKYGWT